MNLLAGLRRIIRTVFLLLVVGVPIIHAGTFNAGNRAELAQLEARVRASQFLSRATFGATPQAIDTLAQEVLQLGAETAFGNWIDAQFDLPESYHHAVAKQMILDDGWPDLIASGLPATRYRHYAWWHVVVTAPDQLRQRMAWALAQVFVTNEFNGLFSSKRLDASGEPQYLGVVDYYDMLVRDAFANYRDLLEDVTLHPVMGIFLSHLRNRKADPGSGTFPDENYAREVQQLMSIGLYMIKANGDYRLDQHKDPVPAYDNEDIKTFARVFTGLDFAGDGRFGRNAVNLHLPMEMHDDAHDQEPKTLHNGVVLPAGQSGEQDISDALDNLFEHPNTGPFISRLLIQRLIKSNPSSRYIQAVANAFEDNGQGIRGDFRAVLKAIYLNKEALESYSYKTSHKNLTLTIKGGGTEDSRLQEPVLRYSAMLRNFSASSTHPSGYLSIPDRSTILNQEPYRSPSIFNFYLPNHVPGGALPGYRPRGRIPNDTIYAPEFQILTSVAANRIANQFRADVQDAELDLNVRQWDPVAGASYNLPVKVQLDFSRETALASDPGTLLQHLDLLMCQGSMDDANRAKLVEVISTATTDPGNRARGAILALLGSPDCAVHD